MSDDSMLENAKISPEADSQVDNHEDEDRWLGRRVRQRRQHCGLSIRQLAYQVELSAGMVSQIERGLSTPSLRSLRLLANALDVPVAWFFPDSQEFAAEQRYIVRQDQRKRLNVPDTGVVQEVVSPNNPSDIEVYEIHLKAGASSSDDLYSHDGEKAGLILSGLIELQIGEDKYMLGEGDGFRFPSTQAHRFANPGPREARLIWIVHARKEQN